MLEDFEQMFWKLIKDGDESALLKTTLWINRKALLVLALTTAAVEALNLY